MKGEGVQPSRSSADLRQGLADRFQRTARTDLSAAAALTAGWTRRQLLDVALTLATTRPKPLYVDLRPLADSRTINGTIGPRREATEVAWTDESLRAAHTAWNHGVRTVLTIEGERMYQRLSKRRRRDVAS